MGRYNQQYAIHIGQWLRFIYDEHIGSVIQRSQFRFLIVNDLHFSVELS